MHYYFSWTSTEHLASFTSLFWFYGPQLYCFCSLSQRNFQMQQAAAEKLSKQTVHYLPSTKLYIHQAARNMTPNEYQCCSVSTGYVSRQVFANMLVATVVN